MSQQIPASNGQAAKRIDGRKLVADIFSASWLTTLLAVVASFIFGGILIAASNANVQTTAGYLFARPSDFFAALWNSVYGAYEAMFRGSVFNFRAEDFLAQIKPITETFAFATPITLAGLGLAVAFRSGLFNIGAKGQIIFGWASTWIFRSGCTSQFLCSPVFSVVHCSVHWSVS
jgi:simple sugar transport system permease protein